MIKRYTNIALFKSKVAPSEPNMKDPYYELTAKIKGTDDKIYAGKFWFKKSESGLNYFSGELQKPYESQAGAHYDGYVLVSVKELDRLEAELNKHIVISGGYVGEVGSTGEEPDFSKIPF